MILCYPQTVSKPFYFESTCTYAIGGAESQELEALVGDQASGFGCVRHACCGCSFDDGFGDCLWNYANELALGLCKAKNRGAEEHWRRRGEVATRSINNHLGMWWS